jgi:3-phosphoshikimate 1-carboxyvinyltransferase
LIEIQPLEKPPTATIRVPGSKSITNRALVLAALTGKGYGWAIRGALRSEDTEVMIEGLRQLGFRVLTEWPESTVFVSSEEEGPLIPAQEADLFVGNSGTTMRFLTALASLGHGRYRLDGVPRMRQRPIADLLDALCQLGAGAFSESQNGCPPVIIRANGLKGGTVRVKGSISSQFLSGLMMVAPFAQREVIIEVELPLVSWPYAYMTARLLMNWGLQITHGLDSPGETHLQIALANADRAEWGQLLYRARRLRFHVAGRQWQQLEDLQHQAEADMLREGLDPRHKWLREYQVEPDASAASYFLAAAAITGGRVILTDLHKYSLQGDVRLVDLLADMGCTVQDKEAGLFVSGDRLRHGVDVDMNDISDTVMTLAAVACFAERPTTIRNVAHIRHKETDRLNALATELRLVGAEVEEFADGLKITPRRLHGATIETYNDHRMAMSMALIGLRVPGIVIRNPGCVAKTYPHFFDDLERLRR